MVTWSPKDIDTTELSQSSWVVVLGRVTQTSGHWSLGTWQPSLCTQFCSSHFGMAQRREQEQQVLPFRGPCSDSKEVINHLLCARLDAGHLTYIFHVVLPTTQAWAIMMSINRASESEVHKVPPLMGVRAGIPVWGLQRPCSFHCISPSSHSSGWSNMCNVPGGHVGSHPGTESGKLPGS